MADELMDLCRRWMGARLAAVAADLERLWPGDDDERGDDPGTGASDDDHT